MNYKEVEMVNKGAFYPVHIFECGQAFHWEREEDGSYTTISQDKWVNVSISPCSILFKMSGDDFSYWENYFDLKTNYEDIIEELNKIPLMKEATDYGEGIRILRQDPFETIMTFILSANNHIPRIKKGILQLSERYGKEIGEFKGRRLFAFPTVEEFSKIRQEDLRNVIKVGYRDKAMFEAARMIREGELDLQKAFTLPTEGLRKELLKLPGVGPKVCDCILLFAYSRMEVFPTDVWIHRVMEDYIFREKAGRKIINEKSTRLFKDYSGYAQQYLFYYGRATGIGKA